MKTIILIGILLISRPTNAQNIITTANSLITGSKLNKEEISNGLKEALRIGAEKACLNLGKSNGFYSHASLKIVIPPEAQKIEKTLRSLGMNTLVDDFILSLNRAAEDACASATPIFIRAINEMTVLDGIQILQGGESGATNYVRLKTATELQARINPIIQTSLTKVNATAYWTKIVTAYQAIPFSNKKINPDLAVYVTEKALEGIYTEIASQEKEIRMNPLARTSAILKLVFEKK